MGERVVKDEDYLMIATVLLLLWLVALLGLMFGSEEEFRKTFYSFRTARGYSRALFDSGVDETMIQVLEDHRSYYERYQEEIKDWLSDNWENWHSERPVWLTEGVVAGIPLDLVPGGDLFEPERGGVEGGNGEVMIGREMSLGGAILRRYSGMNH